MVGQKAASLLAIALLPGCAATPKPAPGQDVEFLRGCWVAKDAPGGQIRAFLRLLPDGADGPSYRGAITLVLGGAWNPGTRYEFARDGSAAVETNLQGETATYSRVASSTWSTASAPAERAVYADAHGTLLVADGGNDTLKLSIVSNASGNQVISPIEFDGERDGCD
jgi:hypothetical protein